MSFPYDLGDLTGKYVIVRNDALADQFKSDDPKKRLFHATGGFGCNPEALGTKVFGKWIYDNSEDFIRRGSIERLATEDEIPLTTI
jgi:hypothetical protein